MTDETISIRSEAAMGRDRDEPELVHCARCGDEGLSAMFTMTPMQAPPGSPGYSALLCDTCAQRVVDLLVNPHMFITALTINDVTKQAEIMIDGTGISRPDAISMLITAAEMLTSGDAEVVAHYDPNDNQDES